MASSDDQTVVNINTNEENPNTIVARRRGKETFDALHRTKKAERTKEEKELDQEWTKHWLDKLDDVTKIGLSLGTMALLGITLTNFQSLDGRDKCDAGPEVVKMILKTGGVALMLLTAVCIKDVAISFQNTKDKLKKKILRFGFLLSAAFAAAGIIMLGIYFAGVFEVRLGIKGCDGLSTTMTNAFLAWGGLGGSVLILVALFAVIRG
ncbi:hypothetical protein MKX03_022501 [Papaver bracteatum]|nr:hypothetical protein MKX03_022501 [Papaver bracteatum]